MDSLEQLLENKQLLKLKNKIRSIFSFLDEDDIESAYNFSIWKAQEKFKDNFNSKFTTFFYSILIRECINLGRTYRQNNRLYDNFEIKESEFKNILMDLSDDERNLLVQKYLEQKTLREISIELNISYEEVRRRLKKCLKKLKEE